MKTTRSASPTIKAHRSNVAALKAAESRRFEAVYCFEQDPTDANFARMCDATLGLCQARAKAAA